MKRLILIVAAMLCLTFSPALFAQEHVEFGVFADYLNLRHADQGFWGLGGRIGAHVAPHVALEGEIAYDFTQSISSFTDNGLNTVTSSLHLLHGTFGPKIYGDVGPLRAFIVLKGGFLNFAGGGGGRATSNFANQIGTVPGGDTNGVFYPGVGFTIHAGPIGLRAEAGDFMYFDRGANHNVRVTFGPVLTF